MVRAMTVIETSLDRRGVLTVAMVDVDNRNALSARLTSRLVSALEEADADPAVRVVVLTNAGSVFCAGADLREQSASQRPAGGTAPPPPYELFGWAQRSPKPYVGRIAGHCVAGGMGLAAGMDVAIAADDTRWGFTEVRLGLTPAMIAVVCLPKMRPGEARAAMLRGRRFDAAEAARLGLVNAAVPRERLDEEVEAVVTDLLAGGPGALAATKQLLAEISEMSVDEAFEWASNLSGRLFASEEGRAGMAAYLEKRPAPWVL
jgi:methylglutaconyl-CoA hydratase